MKRFLALTLATATVGFFAAGSAFAADDLATNTGTFDAGTDSVVLYTVGMAANGIEASRHNVGGTGNYIAVRADADAAGQTIPGTAPNSAAIFASNDPAGKGAEGGGSSEICVFCHTPHHTVASSNPAGNFDQGYGAPLWNRRGVTPSASYVTYGTTIGGTNVGAPSGVTLACLSCHDGNTAIDNLVNGPGENAMSDRWGGVYGDANSQGFTLYDVFGPAPGGMLQIGDEERLNIGNGAGSGTGAAFNLPGIQGDLSNDHPVSVPYSDGNVGAGAPDAIKRASLRDRTTTISTIDLASGLYFTTATAYGSEMLANLTQNRWADKGFISDTATIADMLRGGNVECSSCHDPHFKNLSNADLVDNTTAGERIGDDAAGYAATIVSVGAIPGASANAFARATTFAKQDGLFLRRVGGNAGSGVCRTCHNK